MTKRKSLTHKQMVDHNLFIMRLQSVIRAYMQFKDKYWVGQTEQGEPHRIHGHPACHKYLVLKLHLCLVILLYKKTSISVANKTFSHLLYCVTHDVCGTLRYFSVLCGTFRFFAVISDTRFHRSYTPTVLPLLARQVEDIDFWKSGHRDIGPPGAGPLIVFLQILAVSSNCFTQNFRSLQYLARPCNYLIMSTLYVSHDSTRIWTSTSSSLSAH